MSGPLRVEIAYALAQRAVVKTLQLPPGAVVADALRAAALDPDFAGVDLSHCPVGIFGVLARPDQALEAGDRIEIYRKLAADPKAARRERARQARRQ